MINSLGKRPNDRPRWRNVAQVFGDRRPPRELLRWLLNPGSLTHSLRRYLGDSLNLRLEGQLWRRPSLNEARLLDISTSNRCLERRVTLLAHDEPVVLAHSLMPGASLVGGNRRLAWLGTRPLGEVLFADPSVRRQILEMARLEPKESVFPGLDEPVWARRSVFQVRLRPLLVYEAFLPRLFEPVPTPVLVQRNAA